MCQHIVTASGDQTARVWNAATGQLLRKLVGHSAAIVSAAFSPDGQRIRRVHLQLENDRLLNLDFNVQHFHEKLRELHGIRLSYSWVVELITQARLAVAMK